MLNIDKQENQAKLIEKLEDLRHDILHLHPCTPTCRGQGHFNVLVTINKWVKETLNEQAQDLSFKYWLESIAKRHDQQDEKFLEYVQWLMSSKEFNSRGF